MASLNDTLTVGLILILLFGAVSLYLYTCIQQCEQKLNLVESILLDIKMSAEIREYPELGRHTREPEVHSKAPKSGVEVNEETLYKSVPEDVIAEELESPLLPVGGAEDVQVSDVAADTGSIPEKSVSKSAPTPNYESMTLAELKQLAKQRSISGTSSMKRSQILEALRTSDKPASASSASASATVGGGLSPFLDSVGGLDGETLDGVELLASQ